MQKSSKQQQDLQIQNQQTGLNCRLSAIGRLRYCIWLSSMGIGLLTASMPHAVAAPAFGSAEWFAQAGAYKPPKPSSTKNPNAQSPNSINTPAQARINTQRTMSDLSQALQAISKAQGAQTAAQQISLSKPSQVPNGIGKGGLEVAKGVGQDPGLWQNAKAPTQTTKDGKTSVEIKQTDAKSILTWETFNVGQKTTVHFDQTDGNLAKGGNEWVSLNRIIDPSQKPSEILGTIKAEGSVYILNPNGVIFGGASQVDTRSLVASSLDLFSSNVTESNKAFIGKGLLGLSNGESMLIGEAVQDGQAIKARDAITIEKGARIQTQKNGFSLIAAPVVNNAGSISAEDGQVIIAGASKITANASATDRLNGVMNPMVEQGGDLLNTGIIQSTQGNVSLIAKNITQNGIVGSTTSLTRQGSIDIRAQESIGGSQMPSHTGYVEFGKDSVTTVLLSANNETTTSSDTASTVVKPSVLNISAGGISFQEGSLLIAPAAKLNLTAFYEKGNPSTFIPSVPDRDFVVGRIFIDKNATINVAGMPNVFASQDTLLNIPRIGLNELANSPLLRDSFLYTSKNIIVDDSLQGIREDGTPWIGSPLLNIKGYKDQKTRKIDELMVNGGSINVVGNELLFKQGANLNIDGGYIYYPESSTKSTTKLVTATGELHDIGQADPNVIYAGIGGQFEVNHQRGNQKEIFVNPLLSGQVASYRPAYIVGGNGGDLNIFVTKALFLDGDISAHAYAGMNQVIGNNQPKGGKLTLNNNEDTGIWKKGMITGGAISDYKLPLTLSLLLSDKTIKLADGFTASNSLPLSNQQTNNSQMDRFDVENTAFWNAINTGLIDSSGLSQFTAYANGGRIVVAAGSELSVAKGGSINLNAHQIIVDGALKAVSGQVNLATKLFAEPQNNTIITGSLLVPDAESIKEIPKTDITVGKNAKIDVSGQWVNDTGATQSERTGSQFIHGGKIGLSVASNSVPVSTDTDEMRSVDKTGSIHLNKGSVLDVSSGGYVQPNGTIQLQNAVPVGNAGQIALQVYNTPFENAPDGNLKDLPTEKPVDGNINLLGELRGYGFNHSATLTLKALNIQIGTNSVSNNNAASPGTLALKPALFTEQGFGNYVLDAMYDNTVVSGTKIQLSPKSWIANINNLLQVKTNTDLNNPALTQIGTLDDYHRSATSFSLSAGKYHQWGFDSANSMHQTPDYAVKNKGSVVIEKNAEINADAQAKIHLSAINQIQVDGKITAHGGEISLDADQGSYGYFIKEGTNPTYLGADKGIWLGANSVLDVSGVSLVDSLAQPVNQGGNLIIPKTGKVLDGGTITISNDSGFIAALAGATLNVSGSQDTFDIASSMGSNGALNYQPQHVWSNAGSINLGASSGLYFDGAIKAAGGQGKSQGGSLNIRSINGGIANPLNGDSYQGAKAVVLSQTKHLTAKQAGINKTGDLPDAPQGVLYFNLNQLKNSGIENFNINVDNALRLPSQTPAPIYFSGNINLDLARSFQANASYYVATPDMNGQLLEPQAVTSGYQDHPASTVKINAPYIKLSGSFNSNFGGKFEAIAARGNSILDVQANHLDVQGTFGFANFAKATLNSNGDIRFINNYTQGVNDNPRLAGVLYSSGDLSFNAAQLYPATATQFLIVANAQGIENSAGKTDTTISIGRSKNSKESPVLSAGGSLKFDANHIEQAGVVKAPLGQIILGVSQADDAATLAAWQNLALVKTSSIDVKPTSITSVSLENQIVPYGVTVDGKQWQFNDVEGQKALNVEQLPSKRISFNADQVHLQKDAVIDLSGGGDVQASEWVAGTGGTRDVLSGFNTSFDSGKPQQVALYPDEREVYAIIPNFQSSIAAFDPTFTQDSDHNLGKQVYLSGIDGLAAGTYTLLPAKYATLPNAYRVVQRTQNLDSVAGQNLKMPDGTALVAGYYVDGISGAQTARTTTFEVQSNAVWRQYSEYELSSGNNFFAKTAITPNNAGQLVLNAAKDLKLGAQLKTQAQQGGSKALVDISAQAIQIVSNATLAKPDTLTLQVDDINKLNAGSLLIGGTREITKEGTYINVSADEVRVSNDAKNPLAAPELLLVAKAGDSTQTTQGGVQVESGSVIKAQGDLGNSTQTLIMGKNASTDQNTTAVYGDGALLRVSNAGTANVIRRNLADDAAVSGIINVAANASIDGGKSLTLNASGNTLISGDALISAKDIAVDSGNITFSNQSPAESFQGFAINDKTLAQFEKADSIRLRSYGAIDFVGDVEVNSNKQLTLSAGRIVGDGGKVVVNADQLTLSNELKADKSETNNASTGHLAINASHLIFGEGDKQAIGFNDVNLTVKDVIAMQGQGSLDAGNANLAFKAPVISALLASNQKINTTGTIDIRSSGDLPKSVKDAQINNLGGRIELKGASINQGGVLQANAGQVSLTATKGNLVLADNSLIDVSGLKKTFFDTQDFAPAGRVNLSADLGSISLSQKATIDISAHQEGGNAGRLTLKAPTQTVNLLGSIKGQSLKGQGGEFQLDSGKAVDLNQLSDILAASGINHLVSVRSGEGNLDLASNKTLTASTIELIADATQGHVNVDGKLDASGKAGGQIRLYGRQGVDIKGQLLAKASATDQRGGNVTIATTGQGNGLLDPDYGHQVIDPSNAGVIRIGSNAVIDVSGGSSGGLSGGTVAIRSPLLSNGDVNVSIDNTAQIKGSRETSLEAYAIWSTTDQSSNAAQHFDGIIDPAGWYDNAGKLLAGTFSDEKGGVVGLSSELDEATIKDYLTKYIFKPDTPNTDHQTFYGYVNGDATIAAPGTLMGFIQNPKFNFADRFAKVANFIARPGVELQNPALGINNGDISVLTPWNLAAGRLIGNTPQLDYRFNGVAPVLNLRAEKDVNIQASISDGFFQFDNAFGAAQLAGTSQSDAENFYWNGPGYIQYNFPDYDPSTLPTIDPPTVFDNSDPEAEGQYYTLYLNYLKALTEVDQTLQTDLYQFMYIYPQMLGSKTYDNQPAAPAAAQTTAGYQQYLAQYGNYLTQINDIWSANGYAEVPIIEPLLPPPTLLEALPAIITLNNTPSPTADVGNMIALQMGELIKADSTSYRITAGANFNSANPAQLNNSNTSGSASAGSIVLSGHQSVTGTFVGLGESAASAERSLKSPTMLRTGVGNIELAAAQDLTLNDPLAPAVIYSAGKPIDAVESNHKIDKLLFSSSSNAANGSLVNAPVNSDAAGSISINVGRDILGSQQAIDIDGTQSGLAGRNLTQYWWPWMQTGNNSADGLVSRTSINFANFMQGIMNVGGEININAGRDIRELSVSLPTTWYVDQAGQHKIVGGGNLNVQAGQDILSGSYFVSQGTGNISALGKIGSNFNLLNDLRSYNNLGAYSSPIATLLALQDAKINVQGISGVDIGGIFNPSTFRNDTLLEVVGAVDQRQYSQQSAVKMTAVTGNTQLNTVLKPSEMLYANILPAATFINMGGQGETQLPATLGLTALTGDVNIAGGGLMSASATGNLNILADQSIHLYNPSSWNSASLRMGDVFIGDFIQSLNDLESLTLSNDYGHFSTSLHKDDLHPVSIYGLKGNIENGQAYTDSASLINGINLSIPKASQVYAGQDIINLAFFGQNLRQSDITRVVAGRDIVNTSMIPVEITYTRPELYNNPSVLSLAGSGYFDIQAGRNIGPLSNANDALFGIQAGQANLPLGIISVGNQSINDFNPQLPREGANISIHFGVANGIATQSFIEQYINPDKPAAEGLAKFDQDLVKFVQAFKAGQRFNTGYLKDAQAASHTQLSVSQAWKEFQALAQPAQQLLVDQIFNKILAVTAGDYNNPNSDHYQQYVRGYQAINTLYPAKSGYTENNLLGGENGAASLKETGSLDIRSTTVQTQQGGNIGIYAPGGQLLIGGNNAAPLIFKENEVIAGPSKQGILALEKGDINIFADQSVLLAQSRIFTQQGGNMLIWSSNGDVNAGKGAKTTSELPPVQYLCTNDFYCYIDSKAQVSGAGIAALQTMVGEKSGDVYLVAPRGTVDAGDAGIRVAGNIYVAAQRVAGADNFQVQGNSVGVPTVAQVDTSAMNAANAAVASVVQQALNMNKPSMAKADTLITVDIINMDQTQ